MGPTIPNSRSIVEHGFTATRQQAACTHPNGGRAPRPAQGTGARGPGDWRLVPTRANRQHEAASYLRVPGDVEHRAFKLDVLRVQDGLFPAFDLPPALTFPASSSTGTAAGRH